MSRRKSGGGGVYAGPYYALVTTGPNDASFCQDSIYYSLEAAAAAYTNDCASLSGESPEYGRWAVVEFTRVIKLGSEIKPLLKPLTGEEFAGEDMNREGSK